MSSCCERASISESLWQAANVDMKAMEIIISSHFRTSHIHHAPMDDGTFARVFLFTLENGMQVIARILLPVRESVKTEAEVAAMELVRGYYRCRCCVIATLTHVPFWFLPMSKYCSAHIYPCSKDLPLLQHTKKPCGSRVDSHGIHARSLSRRWFRTTHIRAKAPYCH